MRIKKLVWYPDIHGGFAAYAYATDNVELFYRIHTTERRTENAYNTYRCSAAYTGGIGAKHVKQVEITPGLEFTNLAAAEEVCQHDFESIVKKFFETDGIH